MITEIAEFDIKPGHEAAFQQSVKQALPILFGAEGCHGAELRRCVETPTKFLLFLQWETLAHHTEKFVGSPDWQKWRVAINDFLAGTPKVYHLEPPV